MATCKGNNNEAYYSNLPAGNYTFKVKMVGNDSDNIITDNLNAVFLGTLMSHETPAATARHATFEEETCRYRIFCLIEMRTVGRIAMGTSYPEAL